MMFFAGAVFFLALLGVAVLFALKYWEARSGRRFVPGIRTTIDERALRLKALFAAALSDAQQIVPLSARLMRFLIHEAALTFAWLARAGERRAHRLADMVSYKHRFEKRETRSEFLRKVAEHKQENGLETTSTDGQNV